MYIQQDFIKPNSVERREYQFNIARSSANSNSLVVLPTGLGKTIIALLLIAKELNKKNNKILFFAPTKPLVLQHAQFLRELLTIDDKLITVFTGDIPPAKRKKIWEKTRIIVSTPQVIENDLLSKKINLNEVSFIIFDEAHHGVGEYSYVFISEMYQKQRENNRLVLGMTASPGGNTDKILDVCKNLDIKNIEIRTKYDPDVKPYVHDLKMTWKEIPLPKDFAYAIQLLRKALSERLKILKSVGATDTSSISLINRTKLLEAQRRIQSNIRATSNPSKGLFKAAQIQSESMKIHYALELLQTQGVNALKNYFQRMGKEAVTKGSTKSSRTIMRDNNILEAVAYVKSLNVEHPKLGETVK
ncbi:MAG: Hef nuclease, partial [Candidatus Asgardarchaeum californiense]